MFEKAVRMKLRWMFRGLCSAEDLWDMRVEDLDAIYKALRREAKAQSEDSLLAERTEESEVLNLKIEIIKHVVLTKLDEAEARQQEVEKAARKQQILGIIAQKQDQALMEMDIEELQGLVGAL